MRRGRHDDALLLGAAAGLLMVFLADVALAGLYVARVVLR